MLVGPLGGLAHAQVHVSGNGDGVTATVTVDNWCFGSPETPYFYCTTQSQTVFIPTP